jgi:hypothetical protein
MLKVVGTQGRGGRRSRVRHRVPSEVPEAAATLEKDTDVLLTFFELPRGALEAGTRVADASRLLHVGAVVGAQSLKLLGGAAGKSKILLKAGNNSSKAQVSMPTGIAAALAGSSSATMQIHGSGAPECLSATLGTVVKDTGSFFKAK